MRPGRLLCKVLPAAGVLMLSGCGQAMMSARLDDYEKAFDSSLRIETAQLPPVRLGQPYAAQLVASSESRPVRWRIAAGHLPDGLALDGNGGRIAGTPRAVGQDTIVVEASAAAPSGSDGLPVQVRARSLTLRVVDAPITAAPSVATTPSPLPDNGSLTPAASASVGGAP